MKTKLTGTWQPSERILNLARSRGMPIEDWLYHLLPEWRLYWLDRNIKRDSWDSTFWNHAKKEWEKVDKSRLYRPRKQGAIDLLQSWIEEPPDEEATKLFDFLPEHMKKQTLPPGPA